MTQREPGITVPLPRRWLAAAANSGWLSLVPPFLAIAALILVPCLVLLLLSFRQDSSASQFFQFDLEGYKTTLTDRDFWQSFAMSVAFTLLTVAAQAVLGLVAATTVNLFKAGRMAALLTVLYFLPYTVPVSACARAWQFLTRENGLYASAGTMFGVSPTWWYSDGLFVVLVLASIWQFFPFVFLTSLARLRRVSPQLYRSAEMDGASMWLRVVHVSLPALWPTFWSAIVLRVAFMFTKVDLAWMLGGNSAQHRAVGVLPLYIFEKSSAASHSQDSISAAICMALLMVLSGVLINFMRPLAVIKKIGSKAYLPIDGFFRQTRLVSFLCFLASFSTIVFAVIPFVALILASLSSSGDLDRGLSWQAISHQSLENYRLSGSALYEGYKKHLGYTVEVSGMTTITVVLFSLLAAYGLTRSKGRYLSELRRVPLLGYLFPPIISVIAYGYLTNYCYAPDSPLRDSLLAVTLAHISFCLPFGIWLMVGYFDAIPLAFDRAAAADGANWLTTLFLVLLPRALPGVMAVGMFSFILSWDDVAFSLYLSPVDIQTLPVWATMKLPESSSIQYGSIAAVNSLICLAALLCFGCAAVWTDQRIRRETQND